MSVNVNVNVRPAKKTTEEKKENEVKLTETAKQILESIEKFELPEKFYDLEDKIAVDKEHEKIYDEVAEDAAFLRKALEDYMEGKPTTTATIAKLARLRRNTRLCYYATAQIRKEVAERMEVVDTKLLQLQNVTSEVQHIQKEIDRCLDFSAGDEDLELISVEEFYQQAPESLSKPEETMGDEHEQYVARLKFEMDQRQDLLSTLQELEGRRNVLQSDIRGKEVRLQGLKPKLEDLAKEAEPAFEMVGAKFKDLSMEEDQKQLALTLPSPLIVAHIHAMAYKEIHDDKHFDFRIVGSNDNSQNVKEETDSKRRRKEDETTQEKVNEMAGRIFDVHPMSLEFDIDCANMEDFKVTMTIQYLTELKVTTAKWHIHADSKLKKSPLFSTDSLMSDLFPGDSGDQCPNTVGAIKMEHLKLNFDTNAKQLGKPYRFLQDLSLEGQSTGISVTEHLRKVLKAIRERISQRFVLDAIIRSLEAKKTDEIGADLAVKINSFKNCDDESFIASIPTSLSQLLSKSAFSDRFSYKLEVEDAGGKKLTAFISIPADFPRRTALFGLSAPEGSNVDTVKEIEDRLNNEADYVDDVNSLKEQLSLLVKHIDLS
uniref:THO complex subunit 5 homolog n=1 Tax=Caenorhabditis japonica TaxID=281687 RepID=A0A8R1DHN7_CAEJA